MTLKVIQENLTQSNGKIQLLAPLLIVIAITFYSLNSMASQITLIGFSLISSRLQNRIGSRFQLAGSLFLQAILCVLSYFSSNSYFDLAFQVAFGIVNSLIYTSLCNVIKILPDTKSSSIFYQLAFSFVQFGNMFSYSVDYFSLRLGFCKYYPIAALLVVASAYSLLILTKIDSLKLKLDVSGCMISLLSFLCFSLIFTAISGSYYMISVILTFISTSAFLAFYFVERQAIFPILPLYLIQRPLVFICLEISLNMTIILGMTQNMLLQNENLDMVVQMSFLSGSGVVKFSCSILLIFLQKNILNKQLVMFTQTLVIITIFVNIFSSGSNFLSLFGCQFIQGNLIISQGIFFNVVLDMLPLKYSQISSFVYVIGCSTGYCLSNTILSICFRISSEYQDIVSSTIFMVISFIIILIYQFGLRQQVSEVEKKKFVQSQVREVKGLPFDAFDIES